MSEAGSGLPAWKVRAATVADAAAIAAVHVDAWRQAYAGVLPQAALDSLSVEARAKMWSQAIAGTRGRVLVAEDGTEVLGFAACGPCRDPGSAATDHELWAIYVAPGRWRTGAGRALWRGSRDAMVAAGAAAIVVWVLAANQRARGFYQSMGFRLAAAAGSRSITVGGTPVDEVRYLLRAVQAPPHQPAGDERSDPAAPPGPTSHASPWADQAELVPSGPSMRSAAMRIRIDDLTGPEIQALLEEHLAHMHELSPPESVHALDLSGLRSADVTFWTVWDQALLLGCGALRQLTATHGEVKSMRTPEASRGRGAARAVLQHVIDEARSRGYHRLSLETGSQPGFAPARTLYRSFGFAPCGPFGDYTDDPNSLFMTLAL